jgi:hypothetical protein
VFGGVLVKEELLIGIVFASTIGTNFSDDVIELPWPEDKVSFVCEGVCIYMAINPQRADTRRSHIDKTYKHVFIKSLSRLLIESTWP